MKKVIYSICIFMVVFLSLNSYCIASGPVITNLTYDNITQTGVSVYWTTDSPADSRIRWMAPDSNYQALIFTDSIYNSASVTSHVIPITNLQPAKIYKYQIASQNAGGTTLDSGYFITQSVSTGRVEVYFNHSVDTTVSTGEKAKGNQNFENLMISRIDSAQYSIDIAIYDFEYYNSIATAIINAKNRGVKIRFVNCSTPNTPLIDTLIAHGIPVIKRNYDTTHAMHNKFIIFDYRYNTNTNIKLLWTGSTNVDHAQFNQDRNNVIVIQDESLCALYTREFEEMWGSHTDMPIISRAKFGPMKVDNVPHILNVAGTRMEVYFSPSDSVQNFFSNLILTKTTKSVFFCIYSFQLEQIEDAMHTLFNNGKQIKGVFDLTCSNEVRTVFRRMKGLSVPGAWNPPADVYVDSTTGLLHHKYLIIDANSTAGNKIAVTGSYNWGLGFSYNNDENLLFIFSPRVNNLYYQEFYKRFRGAGGETIGIQKISSETPSKFSLSQNYPNPFNPTTNIQFSMCNYQFVTLKVFDMLGREIATLVNEKLAPGSYKVTFNGMDYSSGVYFYRLTTNNFTDTKRMLLIK
ncbi:MAG: phospholipase D-like domain-containing protein [Ignavibacteriae bacterium]|nr:phospholipase D-like domain-containing protein [Ignavibacteriota bacterium]